MMIRKLWERITGERGEEELRQEKLRVGVGLEELISKLDSAYKDLPQGGPSCFQQKVAIKELLPEIEFLRQMLKNATRKDLNNLKNVINLAHLEAVRIFNNYETETGYFKAFADLFPDANNNVNYASNPDFRAYKQRETITSSVVTTQNRPATTQPVIIEKHLELSTAPQPALPEIVPTEQLKNDWIKMASTIGEYALRKISSPLTIAARALKNLAEKDSVQAVVVNKPKILHTDTEKVAESQLLPVVPNQELVTGRAVPTRQEIEDANKPKSLELRILEIPVLNHLYAMGKMTAIGANAIGSAVKENWLDWRNAQKEKPRNRVGNNTSWIKFITKKLKERVLGNQVNPQLSPKWQISLAKQNLKYVQKKRLEKTLWTTGLTAAAVFSTTALLFEKYSTTSKLIQGGLAAAQLLTGENYSHLACFVFVGDHPVQADHGVASLHLHNDGFDKLMQHSSLGGFYSTSQTSDTETVLHSSYNVPNDPELNTLDVRQQVEEVENAIKNTDIALSQYIEQTDTRQETPSINQPQPPSQNQVLTSVGNNPLGENVLESKVVVVEVENSTDSVTAIQTYNKYGFTDDPAAPEILDKSAQITENQPEPQLATLEPAAIQTIVAEPKIEPISQEITQNPSITSETLSGWQPEVVLPELPPDTAAPIIEPSADTGGEVFSGSETTTTPWYLMLPSLSEVGYSALWEKFEDIYTSELTDNQRAELLDKMFETFGYKFDYNAVDKVVENMSEAEMKEFFTTTIKMPGVDGQPNFDFKPLEQQP